jgi:hypothetical protein
MLLHHIITVTLYVGGYMMNFLTMAMITVLCLDIADLFVSFARAVSETKYKIL